MHVYVQYKFLCKEKAACYTANIRKNRKIRSQTVGARYTQDFTVHSQILLHI